MMRRTFLSVALLTIFILTAAWIDSGTCQEKPVSLKLGHAVAPEHPYHLGAVKFSELVRSLE